MRDGFIKRRARELRPGDVVGSGEMIAAVECGLYTPKGKVEVTLLRNGKARTALWNASTLIGVQYVARPE